MEPQEPTLAVDAVQRRVLLHGFAHVGHVLDERGLARVVLRRRFRGRLASLSHYRHWRRRPSKVVYVPDTGSKERNCVQPGGPIVGLRGSSSARLGGTRVAPTRSTGSISGLSVAGGTPSDCFDAAGLSSVEVRFSSLRTVFSSRAEGVVSAAGGFSSVPTDSLFDGPAISGRAILRLSSALARLSTRAPSALSCSINIFRSPCSPDRRVAIACFASSYAAGEVSCFDCKVDKGQYTLAGLFAQMNAPIMPPKTITNNHGSVRRGRTACW